MRRRDLTDMANDSDTEYVEAELLMMTHLPEDFDIRPPKVTLGDIDKHFPRVGDVYLINLSPVNKEEILITEVTVLDNAYDEEDVRENENMQVRVVYMKPDGEHVPFRLAIGATIQLMKHFVTIHRAPK